MSRAERLVTVFTRRLGPRGMRDGDYDSRGATTHALLAASLALCGRTLHETEDGRIAHFRGPRSEVSCKTCCAALRGQEHRKVQP